LNEIKIYLRLKTLIYCFNHPHVINFLTFIHNNKNIPNLNIIRDICDYFIAEIINSNRQIYSSLLLYIY
jgi:hypothetical protein